MTKFKSLTILLGISLAGCYKLKDKIDGGSTTIVQISPTASAVDTGNQKTFTARVSNNQGVISEAALTWSLSDAALGTLAVSNTNAAVFTAGTTLGLSGTVRATYNGVTGTAQVWVGATPPASTGYGFFSEILTNGMKLDVPNPTDIDGGFLGVFQGVDDVGGCGTLHLSAETGSFTEGGKSLKSTVGGIGGSCFAGIFFKFGFPLPSAATRDLSAYNQIKFDFRGPVGQPGHDVYLKLESLSGNNEFALSTKGATFDDAFHSLIIPLSDFTSVNLSNFQAVVFSVKSPGSSGSFDFYIDNLRFE